MAHESTASDKGAEDLPQQFHEAIAAMHPEFCSPDTRIGDDDPARQTLLTLHDFCVSYGAACAGKRPRA